MEIVVTWEDLRGVLLDESLIPLKEIIPSEIKSTLSGRIEESKSHSLHFVKRHHRGLRPFES